MPRSVAILLFDDVEVLDFAGPFEVFAITGQREGPGLFQVFTVAEKAGPVTARNGLTVTPNYGMDDAPQTEILLVPGGWGTRRLLDHQPTLDFIRQKAAGAELVLSVCTGALLLAKAGLLDGLDATTHHGALGLLAQIAPNARVHAQRRIADNGRIIVSAGVSAGIDMALHVVAKLHGKEQALETARHMEYNWVAQASARADC